MTASAPASRPRDSDPAAAPNPARISRSETRSGTSFQKAPSGLPMRPSTATSPSNRLHSNRICVSPAPATSNSPAQNGPVQAESAKAANASAAATTDPIEMWLGWTRSSTRRRVT